MPKLYLCKMMTLNDKAHRTADRTFSFSFFLSCGFNETKYTTVVAFRSLQQPEEQHEWKCVSFFSGLTVVVGRSLIIVEVSLPLIGHASLGTPPLPSSLHDKTRHPHETGDRSNLYSQQASGRTLAGIGNHEPWPAVIDIKQWFDWTEERLDRWGRHVNDPLCVKFMTFHTDHVVNWWSELHRYWGIAWLLAIFVRELWRDAT